MPKQTYHNFRRHEYEFNWGQLSAQSKWDLSHRVLCAAEAFIESAFNIHTRTCFLFDSGSLPDSIVHNSCHSIQYCPQFSQVSQLPEIAHVFIIYSRWPFAPVINSNIFDFFPTERSVLSANSLAGCRINI